MSSCQTVILAIWYVDAHMVLSAVGVCAIGPKSVIAILSLAKARFRSESIIIPFYNNVLDREIISGLRRVKTI